MIRQALEKRVGEISDFVFKTVMEIVTIDIQIAMKNKFISLDYILNIAEWHIKNYPNEIKSLGKELNI